jgi:hypothetical protein
MNFTSSQSCNKRWVIALNADGQKLVQQCLSWSCKIPGRSLLVLVAALKDNEVLKTIAAMKSLMQHQ